MKAAATVWISSTR